MLRGVLTLAALGVVASGAAASASELITFPTIAAGNFALAPAPLATLDVDWLGAFAIDRDADVPLIETQFSEFLSGDPANGVLATVGLTGVTWKLDPPATARQDGDWSAPFDFQPN